MFTKIIQYIKSQLKQEEPCYKGKDGAPDVRYHYQGSKLIVNKEDALDRAIWVMNNSIKEIKEDKKFIQELNAIRKQKKQ